MNFRKATKNDVSVIVEMIADDELGKKRENFKIPLPSEYLKAFEKISSDENQELIVVENKDLDVHSLGILNILIPHQLYNLGLSECFRKSFLQTPVRSHTLTRKLPTHKILNRSRQLKETT